LKQANSRGSQVAKK